MEEKSELNKRDIILSLMGTQSLPPYIPAAFFMHFGSEYHQGQAAIDKHIEFFRSTGMDLVKIQYEEIQPAFPPIEKPEDWERIHLYPDDFFEPTIEVVKGLVNATRKDAVVILTLYSPFMWISQITDEGTLENHLRENPEAVKKGLDIMTENVLKLVRGCKRVGVDGFYASTQGGEAFRFKGTDIFEQYVKPTDLVVWDEIKSCTFNILHICDFYGGYEDLSPFIDYPSQVINCSLKLGDHYLTPKEISEMFGRPFMGGMDRKGVIATGSLEEIRRTVEDALKVAPERFILAADCTILPGTPWSHLQTAIDAAHHHHR